MSVGHISPRVTFLVERAARTLARTIRAVICDFLSVLVWPAPHAARFFTVGKRHSSNPSSLLMRFVMMMRF
jgi:hypothetical protein